jgi:hypothetical protein
MRAVLVLIVLGVVWAVGWEPWSSEITLYRAHCDQAIKFDKCTGKIVNLDRMSFKVFPDSQTVLYWYPDGADPDRQPRKMTGCVVRNKRNWSCQSPVDPDSRYVMIEGRYSSGAQHVMYLPKWLWWSRRRGIDLDL